MGKQVEFYLDFGSPYSYLAYKALPGIAVAHAAQIVWRPMLLGGMFKSTGNQSPAEIPAKERWLQLDLKRWADRRAILRKQIEGAGKPGSRASAALTALFTNRRASRRGKRQPNIC